MTSPAVGTGIVTFIEARQDEKEAKARQAWGSELAAALFAEVAKDRAILALHAPHNCIPHQRQECANCVNDPYPCQTVRLLAAVDADHPDYDPSWKPVVT